jgi:diketogulonate reductase-like aldo/keto reductase
MQIVTMRGGRELPVMGQGTWFLGLASERRAEEERALRSGIELGMRLIDTAEVYGEGATEEFLGSVLPSVRSGITLVSKVHPRNATRHGIRIACERSLRRLRTDHLDIYLLHWREEFRLQDAVEGFEDLVRQGKIGAWGVSNFDIDDINDLMAAGGRNCCMNQVYYNLANRQAERDLFPLLDNLGILAMAYSPIDQSRLPMTPELMRIAEQHGVSPLQLALAWVHRRPTRLSIPRSGKAHHVALNRAALDVALSADDIAQLDAAYPPPSRSGPIPIL